MANVVYLDEKHRGYPIILKQVGGETIDSLSEDQFKKFCADTGTEWFRRLNVSMKE